jgi:hypothetical protein
MEDSDAANYAATSGGTENYWIGNTCVDCGSYGFAIGRTAASTDAGKVVFLNNVLVSKDGGVVGAVNLDGYSDDLGLLETPDFSVAHGYTNLVTRSGATAGLLTTAGDNFVSADPLLDKLTFEPSSGSPCINASCGEYHTYDVYGNPAGASHIGAVWPTIASSKGRR